MTPKNELVLVACSGGLDSSTTLSILKLAGYNNMIACHFNYGHRGAAAEKIAIQNVCEELQVDLRIFDLESIYGEIGIDNISMLQNESAEIVTGTTKGLKTTAAWTPARNLLFLTVMGALGEAECMRHDYDTIYLAGGMLQLTESSIYCDNTPYFVDAVKGALKYGTLIGNRFKVLYCLSNLMKSEQFVLIKEFKLEDVYRHTISCDRPIVEDGVPKNCSKNGMAACGSGLLSMWGASMVGLDDLQMRNFYEIIEDYVAHIPGHIKDQFTKAPSIEHIINRILLPADRLDNLRKYYANMKG